MDKHLALPSPYLVAPFPLFTHSDLVLSRLLSWLCDSEADVNKALLKSDVGACLFNYRRFVCCEFFRRAVDENFQPFKLKPSKMRTIEPEVKLWLCLWKMLKELHDKLLFPPTNHAAISLSCLVRERELVCFVAFTSSNEKVTITKRIASLQAQNRMLESCDNPFDKGRTPQTWQVFDRAIALANQSEPFRREFYLPIVKARQSFMTSFRKSNPRIFKDGKLQHQGRRRVNR